MARNMLAALACVLTHGYCSGLALSLAVSCPQWSGSLCVLCFCHVLCLSPGNGEAPVRVRIRRACAGRGGWPMECSSFGRPECTAQELQCRFAQLCTLPRELQRAQAALRNTGRNICCMKQPARPLTAAAWVSGTRFSRVGRRGEATAPFTLRSLSI